MNLSPSLGVPVAAPRRPKLGRPYKPLPATTRVVTTVSFLPQHAAWLREQPGGVSATVRRLVAAARAADTKARNRLKDVRQGPAAGCGR